MKNKPEVQPLAREGRIINPDKFRENWDSIFAPKKVAEIMKPKKPKLTLKLRKHSK